MPKNYVKQMREQGHDDVSIQEHMIAHGWHPNQVEELFISMGHVADAESVSPPEPVDEELLSADDISEEPEHNPDDLVPNTQDASGHKSVTFEYNAWQNITSNLRTLTENPTLFIMWVVLALSTAVSMLTAFLLLLILGNFASIAVFGLASGDPSQLLLFIGLSLLVLWGIAANYYALVRTLQSKILLLAVTRQKVSMHSIAHGLQKQLIRCMIGQSIFFFKLLFIIVIPVTIVLIFGGERLNLLQHARLINITTTLSIVAALIVYIRNSYLIYVLMNEPEVAIKNAATEASGMLAKPLFSLPATLGWIGVSAFLAAIATALTNILFDNDTLISLAGINYLGVAIFGLIVTLLLSVQDLGFARLYAGIHSAQPGGIKPTAASHGINIAIFILGVGALAVLFNT